MYTQPLVIICVDQSDVLPASGRDKVPLILPSWIDVPSASPGREGWTQVKDCELKAGPVLEDPTASLMVVLNAVKD